MKYNRIKRITPYWLWNVLVTLRHLPLRLASYIFYICSVKNKIVISNFNGIGFGDNPQYIAEEILRQGLNYDIVWLTKDMSSIMPAGIRKVKFNTIKASYELSTAKVIINNVKNLLPYKKKKEQYYIQTWHGELAFKYIEGECEDKLDPKYVAESKADSSITDLILSGCKIDSEIIKNHFWYSGEIMEKGIPRYDMLFRVSEEYINDVKNRLGIKTDYNVALYAPTFRGAGEIDAYDIDIEAIRDCLQKKTNHQWVIIVRMHPNAKVYANKYNYCDTIINGSAISNPQEIVIVSDLLVTDYSSIMVDFMIMKKPILLYVPDLKEYERTRGLRTIYYELPLIKAKTNIELEEGILKLNFKKYVEGIDVFVKERIISFDDGHASEHVVEKIKDVMG